MAVIDIFKKTQELASLPHIASKVLRMIQDKKTDLKDIARIIESDPILSLKILRVANSPIFATRTKITSIVHALMLLGTKRICNIVLSVSIYSKFFLNTHKQAAIIMERFFNHSYLTGNVAKAFCQYAKIRYDDYEFIGGLMHEIGKMAMLQVHPREYALVQKLIRERRLHDLEAEKEVFGENYVEVGIQVAQLWKLPDEVLMIIAFHRNPNLSEEYKGLVAIVSFSSVYTKLRAYNIHKGEDDEIPYDRIESWKVITQVFPEVNLINKEELQKELDYTIRVAPEAIANFK